MGTLYEGFEIFVYKTLASGQSIYRVRDMAYDYGRRGGVTRISDAKLIIDKYLGSYIAPPVTAPVEMTREAFDQLQAGTVALQDNKILQNTVDQLTQGLSVISQDITTFDLSGVEALREKIQAETQNVIDIGISLDEQKALIVSTLSAEFQALKDTFEQVSGGIGTATADVKNYTSDIQGVNETLKGVIENINASKAGFESAIKTLTDKLAAKGEGGGMFSGLNKVLMFGGIIVGGIAVIKVAGVLD